MNVGKRAFKKMFGVRADDYVYAVFQTRPGTNTMTGRPMKIRVWGQNERDVRNDDILAGGVPGRLEFLYMGHAKKGDEVMVHMGPHHENIFVRV